MAPIRPNAGERLLAATAPIGRASRTMALVAGASLLGHLAVVGTVAVAGRAAPAAPTEIAVEIVHEMPKPAAKQVSEPVQIKSEQAKPKQAKPTPIKNEPAKPEPAKIEPAKSEPAKTEPVKPEPAKPEPARREVTKVAKTKSQPRQTPAPKAEPKIAVAPPAPAREEAAAEVKLAALQRELESLRAEQAQLRAAHDTEAEPSAMQPVALRDAGLGVLPRSFQAVALPATTDGAGEAATYEAIVFSELAKAKGIGRRMGVPGTAGVRFSLDAAGKLVAVELFQWSGIPELDAEALALVRRAVFPPPPQGAQRTFVANVNFEADRAR